MGKKIKLFQVDAFTDKVFGGNPAAICILERWLDTNRMQFISSENNLAETAFVVKKNDFYEIRWFTPTVEVDLCGHATLAAAYVLYNYLDHPLDSITFHSPRSGILTVSRKNDEFTLDFPVDIYNSVEPPKELIEAFNAVPLETYKGKTDYILLFSNQNQIEAFQPNFNLIAKADSRGVIVTSKGEETDFVSRFFAPQSGIDEDPVTGSAHTSLTPIWHQKLGKAVLTAKQLSKRKGDLKCELKGDRVLISGKAVGYLSGEITI